MVVKRSIRTAFALAAVVAVAALPVQDAEEPVTLIPQLPLAPVPVVVGAPTSEAARTTSHVLELTDVRG